jgi:cation:H+ antiporter
VAAAIQPAVLPPTVLSLHIFVMVAFTLVLFAMTYEYDGRGAVSRFEGVMLVAAYLAFTTYVVVQNVRIGA